MFGLTRIQTQVISYAAAAAALLVLVIWLRTDAANDRERALESQGLKNRIEDIESSKETRNEIEGLTDDDLDAALCRILSSPAECDRRRAVQGRESTATQSTDSND